MSYPLQKVPIDLLLYKRFPLIFKDFHDIKDFTMGISKISKLPGAVGLCQGSVLTLLRLPPRKLCTASEARS
jgi:hypothetical protein